MSFTPTKLLAELDAVHSNQGKRRYLVAFSGGLDSTVLLHALAAARQTAAFGLRAAHVNHGLQDEAGHWLLHCRQLCERLSVPFNDMTVQARPQPGGSPEAAARHARYRALASLLREGEILLTAHHQDDQAETLLLQLMRGAGPRGLAAMPAVTPFSRGFHARPLLSFGRDELEAYARQQGLDWVEDPSNQHLGFDRNFLRHRVVPLLKQRWPAMARTVSRSARACAEAGELIGQLADQDLAQAGNVPRDTLVIHTLLGLPAARRRNALYHWLRQNDCPLPSAAQMAQIEASLEAAADAAPVVRWAAMEVRRFQGRLHLLSQAASQPLSGRWSWDAGQPLDLPGLGRLVARPVAGPGLKPEYLRGHELTVMFRRGGERCRVQGQAHHRPLKKLLQEARISPWQRQRIPLLFIDGELAAVVGYWLCDPFARESGGVAPELIV